MPTSVPWRKDAGSLQSPHVEISRPSESDIEPCSPGPFTSSSGVHLDAPFSKRRDDQDSQLYGLGLSQSSYTDKDTLAPQPDHLYIDQNGGAHVSVKPRSPNRHASATDTRSRDRKNGRGRSNKHDSKTSRSKAHTRSGSTIDDLANIAIATSPTFNSGSPTSPYGRRLGENDLLRPATSYVDGYDNEDRFGDRPAKRIRSEKLHPSEWSPRDNRPRTSHTLQTHPSMEDAELLLGLRNGHSFSTNTSPVFASVATFQPPATESLVHPPAIEEIIPQKLFERPTAVEDEQHDDKDAGIDVFEVRKEDVVIQGDVMDVDGSQEETQPPQAVEPIDTKTSRDEVLEESAARDQPESQLPKEAKPATTIKKPRKIKPEVQAEVCAACQKLQRDDKDEDSPTLWIGCEYCKKWFHSACQGFKDKSEARSVDKFVCQECEPKHGQTTFVRKSSRVRTAIDYAGLNEGLVKSSEDSSMHHYIQPIKDGRIKYLQDDFARVRPEILTAEFWENMDNMKRPFVVPACWNPRFGASVDDEQNDAEVTDVQPASDPSTMIWDANGNNVQDSIPVESLDGASDAANHEVVMECDQDYLDMVMPRNLTVRKVSELYGPEQPVPVIDVKSQETKGQWSLNDWANYYEQQGEKPVRNVISLEVSNSPIGKLIRRPKAVRDIDLEDDVWDNETRTTSNKRPVQFYCLMSVADSYTDFHIDFGGSSVYYHILKGVKTFFFIPPEDRYLKEYEKWCNSETQNDSWLGDLCNGNVTRVDLHEGDTAFIPAGWIHSVWTPEDSLVIGGNFLTRLDFELQLKVANIEKTTKVPQKFRYPFFQKVMWYTLLKYLEEDPVPEEVLRDFHADEEYQFLRANPIWLEHGELASDAEPGEPGYSARVYPKSELKGLPYLRDYLYRTACIHADIPVPDINKKQIDAVKASIPKGHGDPLRLIKTFAVWCAWKLGNEPVPKWVHDQGDGLVGEIKEREKVKEETFRVPPERASARNASKIKAASPGLGSDGNDNMSAKSKNGARGGSLRIACDACRKRRIKCRHKEGDDTLVNASPPEIRPRTYSNISVDIPKLASASPARPTFDQSPTLNGTPQDLNSSEVAQAALISLHSQASDPGQITAGTPSNGSAKKGRSKACEECRKSKRRCVHDEYGRIDPAKAAEPSRPRGSTSSKRPARLSDESPSKRYRSDGDDGSNTADTIDMANSSDIDMMIDPALMNEGLSNNAIHHPTETLVTRDELEDAVGDEAMLDPMDMTQDDIEMEERHGNIEHVADLPPTKHEPRSDDIEVEGTVQHKEHNVSNLETSAPPTRPSPELDNSYSPITVDGVPAESTEKVDVKTEDAEAITVQSRHMSRGERGSSSSERTLETGGKSRRSSSNTSGTTHQAAANGPKLEPALTSLDNRGSASDDDVDADEKFARELQAAENGLRRRASMRA